MSRFARERRVFYWEEPLFDANTPDLSVHVCSETGVKVVTPHLPRAREHQLTCFFLEDLMSRFVRDNAVEVPIAWFYTPMALEFFPQTYHPSVVVYDCMDELSLFKGAPPQIHDLERRLLRIADLMFTGGASLFEAKRTLHEHVHAFPSGVDVAHFAQARNIAADCSEQRGIPRPRLGYAGVIDERMDLELIEQVALRRPEWQIVMIGPTAKIEPESLPHHPNIHWMGMKNYADLPKYFASWDVAIMPFALNDATRFISPTKTPEYLSAGLPVVSTPIRDVVRPYGELGLVRIAETPDQFIEAIEQAMTVGMCLKWRERADAFLQTLSWDSVWGGMNKLLMDVIEKHNSPATGPTRLSHSWQENSARV
jgi:glycosyltransferase involved in cell wall biosynthesis